MKTLKKTLCLVLAVVMVVGVLVLPANAAATTAADADAEAAFDTLNEYGVMNGVDANNTPALSKNINRQDMAAIIYRVMTGDTADKYVANYAPSADTFADSATFATWAKGYIGYVGSKGIFKGDNNGNFKPTEEIKGDDVLTVLLRCIGYGQNGEFTGANYAANAKAQAADINLFGGAKGYVNVSEDMSKVVNRGAVAKLTFNAIQAPMAVYYNGTYSVYQDNQGRPSAPNAGAKLNPALVKYDDNKADTPDDDWTGVPYYEYVPTIKFNYTYGAEAKKFDKVIEEVEPVGEYWTQTTLGDIAYEGGIRQAAGAKLEYWLNGADKGVVTATPASKELVGAQGQWTRTYDLNEDGKIDRIVCLDILLAKVTKVNQETTAHGVVMTPATTELEVYTNASRQATAAAAKDAVTATVVGSDYKKDDYVLIYAEQNASNALVSANAKAVIIGAAPSVIGKQTTIYYNQNKHRIDNVDYNDNNRYTLDAAETKGGAFVWYQDLQGNIIGSVVKNEDINLDYAVLTNLIWTVGNPGYAEGTLLYMNGATSKVRVNSIQAYYSGAWANKCVVTLKEGGVASTIENSESKAYVSADPALNAAYQGSGLYEVSINDDGTVDLVGKPGSSDATTDVKYVAANTQIDPEKFEIVTSGTKVYADSSTVFIYKTTDSAGNVEFKRVVGIKNMPYLGGGSSSVPSFYYADITKDGDSIADYVYINDSAAAVKSGSQLIAALSHSYAAKPGTTAKYILERLWMGTGEVANDTVYADLAQLSGVIQELATHAGKLYVATYDVSTKNKITAVAAIDADKGAKYSSNTWAANGSDLTAWGTDHFIVLARSGDSTAANNAKITHSADLTMISGLGKAGFAIATNYTETSKIKVYGAITKEELPDLDFSKYNVYVEVDKGDIVAVYVLDKVAPDGSGVTPGTPTATSVITEVSFNSIVQVTPGAYAKLDDALTNAVAVSKKAFNATEDEVTVVVTANNTATKSLVKSYMSSAAVGTPTLAVKDFEESYALHIAVGGYIVIGAEVSGATTYYAYKIVD